MKYIAFYLPQYHQIPENDAWWGEGFTEWVNVKKATPLFRNHYQPHVPYENDYYDLDRDFEKTMRKQIQMAKAGGLYGFCFYHYWFKDGKKLLEKPIERFLEDRSLDMNYCICWANEAWTRTWDGKEKHILMEQEYGDAAEWKAHFEYLEPFFHDERYIKIDNRPVFVIYRPELIDELDEMVKQFKKMAEEAGFPGLLVVSQGSAYANMKDHSSCIDAYILYEPGYTQNETSIRYGGVFGSFVKSPRLWFDNLCNAIKTRIFKGGRVKNGKMTCTILKYDATWRRVLRRKYDNQCKVFPGGFVNWDNSPRRGLNNSRIYLGSTPSKFGKYMKELSVKAKKEAGTDIVFINAWNEWGEGAHLEPDERQKYGYLNALRDAGKAADEETSVITD